MSDAKHPTVEEYIAQWASQMPGLRARDAEMQFISDMRRAAANGVGYGWMQQMIEVEWNHKHPNHAWGVSYFTKKIASLEAQLKAAIERNKR